MIIFLVGKGNYDLLNKTDRLLFLKNNSKFLSLMNVLSEYICIFVPSNDKTV